MSVISTCPAGEPRGSSTGHASRESHALIIAVLLLLLRTAAPAFDWLDAMWP